MLFESEQYVKALAPLEKTYAIDYTTLYVYYYLTKAHYYVTHHRECFNFLDIAEAILDGQQNWFADVYSL